MRIVQNEPEWRYYFPIQPSGPGAEVIIPKLSVEFIKSFNKEEQIAKGIRQANIRAILVPPTMGKCPRCWTYNADVKGRVCERCLEVVHHEGSSHFQTFFPKYPHVPVTSGWLSLKNMKY